MEKLESKTNKAKFPKTAFLITLAGGYLAMNLLWGFAPTLDELDKGRKREELENANYTLRISCDGLDYNNGTRHLFEFNKKLTRPGRELAYFAHDHGLR